MSIKHRNIDWNQFELLFDAEGNPSIRWKVNNTIVPTHPIGYKGRYLAICTGATNNILFHRAVYFLNEVAQGRVPPDYYVEIHHKDGNPQNNKLENLEALSMEEHRKLHAHARRGPNMGIRAKWQDPVWREKMLKVLAKNREGWKMKKQNKQTKTEE